MPFGIGINTEKQKEGRIKGKQKEIAVDCWFTSKGHTIPRMFKYEDQEGMIHTVRNIRVLRQEDKNYSGIPTVEYRCMIEENEFRKELKLIFFLEEHRWVVIWNC